MMSTPAQALKRSPGAMEEALSRLRAQIVEGDLLPGEQIRQQQMAEQFGVSRVPLREALNVLADQGLLLHRPNQGYFVTKRAPSELLQIRRMLELLETELMDTIEWPDAALMATLKDLNAQMRRHVHDDDWSAVIHKNREFHFRIFALSPDKLILDEVQRLWALAHPFIAAKLSSPELRSRTVDEHDAILAALAQRDRAKCQRALHLHRRSTDLHGGKATSELPRRRTARR